MKKEWCSETTGEVVDGFIQVIRTAVSDYLNYRIVNIRWKIFR